MTVYITKDLAEKTECDQIKEAYDSNDLSVGVYDGVWFFEGLVSGELRQLVKNEMERLYPDYVYIYHTPYRRKEN